jgi:hypothetical protein
MELISRSRLGEPGAAAVCISIELGRKGKLKSGLQEMFQI